MTKTMTEFDALVADVSNAAQHGGSWFHESDGPMRRGNSKSAARARARARVAKIPLRLSRHIAATYYAPAAGEGRP